MGMIMSCAALSRRVMVRNQVRTVKFVGALFLPVLLGAVAGFARRANRVSAPAARRRRRIYFYCSRFIGSSVLQFFGSSVRMFGGSSAPSGEGEACNRGTE